MSEPEPKKEEVKPSDSSKPADPIKEEPKPAPDPKQETKQPVGDSSSSGTQKLLEQALEDIRKERDRREKLEMVLAQQEATRQRLRRVFKTGFKVAKQR